MKICVILLIAAIIAAAFVAYAAVTGGALKTVEEKIEDDAEQIACIETWKQQHAKDS